MIHIRGCRFKKLLQNLNPPLVRHVQGGNAEADEAASKITGVLDDELGSASLACVERRLQQPAMPAKAKDTFVFLARQHLPCFGHRDSARQAAAAKVELHTFSTLMLYSYLIWGFSFFFFFSQIWEFNKVAHTSL
jgi:hypothetical protein